VKKTRASSPELGPQVGRRKFLGGAALGAAGVAGIPAVLAACGTTSTTGGSGGGIGNFPSHPKWNFVFVNHVTTNAFFTPTQYGAADACSIMGCTYQWTGSANSVVSEMVDAMNTAISAGADGIAVALIDLTAFNGPTQNALAAGIPVVSYNADAAGNARLAYIGQDLMQSGFEMGQRAVQVSGVTSGDVVGFIATPGSLNIQPRIDGCKQAFAQYAPGVNFTQVATGAQADQEQSTIDAYVQGHPNVKAYYSVDGGSTAGLGLVSQKYNLPSKGIHCGGFDLEPTTLTAIQGGWLDFTIDQQPYLQGFIPVQQLFLYKLSGGLTQPAETDTGLLFVTKSNVGPYLSTQTRFEGSSSQEKVVS
jgi:simple sugar transport system substrate-binding protein